MADQKSEPPFTRRVDTRLEISAKEVNRILREYARGLHLRGYPATEEKVAVEFLSSSWEDENSYVGPLVVRFTEG